MPSSVPNVLLVTSNGTGMGHLTRQLAVGMAMGARASVTVWSLSVGLPVVFDQGIAGEYCPSYERGWVPRQMWHRYLRDRLEAAIEELSIDVVLFDGVAPYPGLLNARRRLPDVAFAWMRRAMWRPGTNAVHLAKGVVFDLILEPGEIAGPADRGATAGRSDAVVIPPLSMLEVVDPLGRAEAAAVLGIDPDRPTALVTLGSGMLGDVATPGTTALAALAEEPDWQICVTKAGVATSSVPVDRPERVTVLRGIYPLVRYLSAFDAVVSAAGYNAVHEFVPAGLPTLLVPNAATRTDDQIARARWLAGTGLALHASEDDPVGLAYAARSLTDDAVRRDLSTAIAEMPAHRLTGGAVEAGNHLVELSHGFRPSPSMRVRRAVRLADEAVREGVKERLGPERTERIRRLRGRDRGGPATKLTVEVVEELTDQTLHPGALPLLLSDRVGAPELALGTPVEHLVAGSSPEYRARRRRIAEDFYDIVAG